MTRNIFPTEPHHFGYPRETTSAGTTAGPGMTLREYVAVAVLPTLIAINGNTSHADTYIRAAFEYSDEFCRIAEAKND